MERRGKARCRERYMYVVRDCRKGNTARLLIAVWKPQRSHTLIHCSTSNHIFDRESMCLFSLMNLYGERVSHQHEKTLRTWAVSCRA